jgi:Questin oxidase-like
MSSAPDVLDRAFDHVSALEFAPPVRFVNHGPMACEALSTLGFDQVIDGWVKRIEDSLVEAPGPAEPTWHGEFDWSSQLGDSRLLPEWLGYFGRAIAAEGWRSVVATWVPRLMPGLNGALFHGVIRTSHAVRAIDASESSSRRAELTRALANWATWSRPGEAIDRNGSTEDPGLAAAEAGAEGARYFVAAPNILYLHGVTGAMAVQLLADHIGPVDGDAAVAQLRADHRALYRDATPAPPGEDAEWLQGFGARASTSGDPHQVKLVEACRRGFELTGAGVFVTAADTVTTRPRD